MHIENVILSDSFKEWQQVLHPQLTRAGDVCIFVELDDEGEIDPGWCAPNPNTITGLSLDDEKGLMIKNALTNISVFGFGQLPFPEREYYYGYAILRRNGSWRPYQPSIWAEPSPLP